MSVINLNRVKHDLGLILLALMIVGSTSFLQEGYTRSRRAGVGIVLGRPQGLTAQFPFVEYARLNTSLYYDFEQPRFDLHLDHIFIQSKPILVAFYPYFGFGGRLSLSQSRGVQDAGGVTARVPIGLELGEETACAFIELAPALEVLPALGFTVQGAIGIRYHFH